MTETLRVMAGLAARDLRVLRREAPAFLTRTVMQPLLFVFVFAYVFPRIGQGIGGPAVAASGVGFGTVLVPGLVAVAIVFQGIIAVALPLATDLGGTREIEDRVLAPVPVGVVALEKVLFAAAQSVVAGAVVLPMVAAIPSGPVAVRVERPLLLVAVVVLAALLSGTVGLALGTSIEPRQIGLMFSVVVIPLTFLGAVYYPWTSLAPIRWLQLAVLVNPLVYVSEGLRAALTPDVPAMAPAMHLGAMAVSVVVLGAVGLRGFVRRTTG